MHFHKFPYPSNFEFLSLRPGVASQVRGASLRLDVAAGPGDVYHCRVTGPGWEKNESDTALRLGRRKNTSRLQGGQTSLAFSADGALELRDRTGRLLLATRPDRFFGQCGRASLFEFLRHPQYQFYGLGEKWSGFEHSGKTTKFWNTDVWGDFNPAAYIDGRPAADPVYVSIPYLIVKRENTFVGLLLDNPHPTFISTGFNISIADQMEMHQWNGTIHLGAESGQPNLYIIHGPSLAELTRKLQMLVGPTPLPPAWALGYHQCRWGYRSHDDLLELDSLFRRHKVPVDGLWLDIGYMDGYRVFTFDRDHFGDPAKTMAEIRRRGRRVVPIIDPGVKREQGYAVYERGRARKAYCINPQGREFIGLVWPGETVFPDFSDRRASAWWTGEVEAFAKLGIHGAWLDMNDPSTGPVELSDMLFDKGRKPHELYHNQYATGMARATRRGFRNAHPGERPFLLCRSGFIGSSRYTAIWTGDNYSNYHHLRSSIATTLNLALSGIPFNGPDVGGFGGDASPELMRDWFKAGFLFPILRNHSSHDTRRQEPWAFDARTLEVVRRCIQLRYRLRPYLYQLFAAQERTGEAILRPLFYDFADTEALPLGKVDDQFLVGPWIMQAPFVHEGIRTREVVLPGREPWFDTVAGRWLKGGRRIVVRAKLAETPLYIRDKAILPLARIAPHEQEFRAEKVDFHVFLSSDGTAKARYLFDDGKSLSYQEGERSEVEIVATRTGSVMEIETRELSSGFGHGEFTFTTSGIATLRINGRPARKTKSQGIPLCKGVTATWGVK